MTGHLQRLAAGALGETPRVHPLVGSIFSESRIQRKTEAPPTEDRLLIAAEPERRSHGKTPVAPFESETFVPLMASNLEVQTPSRPHSSDAIQATAEARSPEQGFDHNSPIRISSSKRPRQEHRAEPSESLARSPVLAGATPRSEASPASRLKAHRESEGNAPASEDGSAPRASRSDPQPTAVEAQVAAARTPNLLPAERQAAEQRQAEDVQIHIGRIEVVAVPQSAPRPVVTPVRKALSLDEYLRRVGGHAG